MDFLDIQVTDVDHTLRHSTNNTHTILHLEYLDLLIELDGEYIAQQRLSM